MSNFLYICSGNINRSWAAEILAKNLLPAHSHKSCGTGKTAAKNVRRNKKMRLALGADDDISRSQPLTQELIDWATHIVYMAPVYRKHGHNRFSVEGKEELVWDIRDPQFSGTQSNILGIIRNHVEELAKEEHVR